MKAGNTCWSWTKANGWVRLWERSIHPAGRASRRRRGSGRGTLALRRLLQMVREYPRRPLARAVQSAAHYGLYNLERVERMVLREIAGEYFVLDDDPYREELDER